MEYLRENIYSFVAIFIANVLFVKFIEEYLLENRLLKPFIDFFVSIERRALQPEEEQKLSEECDRVKRLLATIRRIRMERGLPAPVLDSQELSETESDSDIEYETDSGTDLEA